MKDILEDLNRWHNLLVVERRFRQQTGGVDLDLVARAIAKSRAYAPSSQQLRTQASETDFVMSCPACKSGGLPWLHRWSGRAGYNKK
jgi:hypothetical protein